MSNTQRTTSDDARPALQQHHIVQEPGEHVFILIECDGRPAISLDITDWHGRRGLGVRVGGMGTASHLLDVKGLAASDDGRVTRFCPFCGTKRDLGSSVDRHKCSKDGWQL